MEPKTGRTFWRPRHTRPRSRQLIGLGSSSQSCCMWIRVPSRPRCIAWCSKVCLIVVRTRAANDELPSDSQQNRKLDRPAQGTIEDAVEQLLCSCSTSDLDATSRVLGRLTRFLNEQTTRNARDAGTENAAFSGDVPMPPRRGGKFGFATSDGAATLDTWSSNHF